MALYQFRACPFCVKTRRAMKRLGLGIELRDARTDPQWRRQLLGGGGRLQVPCLFIPGEPGEARWMYESGDIIAYLERRFAVQAATGQADPALRPGKGEHILKGKTIIPCRESVGMKRQPTRNTRAKVCQQSITGWVPRTHTMQRT